MNDTDIFPIPKEIPAIERETQEMGFKMASDHKTGCLLRSLASTKPSGKFLELGTGTGLSACWLLDGMDASSTLLTVDNDPNVVAVTKRHLGHDSRLTFYTEDGAETLRRLQGERFDFIFADTWPGKIWNLDEALDLFNEGGIYFIDDMLPQPHWPDDHLPKIEALIQNLDARNDLLLTKMNWSTGIIVVTRIPNLTNPSDQAVTR